jgi:hypothetical protein
MVDRTANRGELLLSWRGVFWSGLVAGIVADVVLMGLLWLGYSISPWSLSRLTAAIVLGPAVLPPPAEFDAGVVLTATAVHLLLSFGLAALLGLVCQHVARPTAVFIGGVFGFALYFVNFYGFVFVFPWFATIRNEATFAAHVIFGLVLAYVYKKAQRAH